MQKKKNLNLEPEICIRLDPHWEHLPGAGDAFQMGEREIWRGEQVSELADFQEPQANF